MARSDSRRRSVREEAPLAADRPVQINSQKRFYSSRGNQSAVRTAEALKEAFGSGIALKETLTNKGIDEGRQAAGVEIGHGDDRDPDNKNTGYLARWAQRDAVYDANRMKESLPQALAEADVEGIKDRDEYQDVVNGILQDQFAGLERMPNDVYTRSIAPLLTELNDRAMKAWDDQQLLQLQGEQRMRTLKNAEDVISSAVVAGEEIPWEAIIDEIMTSTNDIYDGPVKRTEMAIMLSDLFDSHDFPEGYDMVAQKFSDGSLTGFGDPGSEIAAEIQKRQAAGFERRAKAEKQADEDWKASNAFAIATIKTDNHNLAVARDPQVIENLREGLEDGPNGEPPIYTPKEVEAELRVYSKANGDHAIEGGRANRFHNGFSRGLSPKDYDDDFIAYSARLEATLARDEKLTPEQRTAGLLKGQLERSIANGKLPTSLKGQFQVNDHSPEAYKHAANMYHVMESIKPGWAATQLDDDMARELKTYQRALAATGDEQLALERVGTFDRGRYRDFTSDIGTHSDEVTTQLANEKPG